MAIANRSASIITSTDTTDDFEDVAVIENAPIENVPVHFVESVGTGENGQTVKRARIRIPSQYPIEAGNVIVVRGERWSAVDVITQRTPQEWSIANCVRLQA